VIKKKKNKNEEEEKEKENHHHQYHHHFYPKLLSCLFPIMDTPVSSEASKFLHHYTAIQPSYDACLNNQVIFNKLTTF
jgi:hypothetical protein